MSVVPVPSTSTSTSIVDPAPAPVTPSSACTFTSPTVLIPVSFSFSGLIFLRIDGFFDAGMLRQALNANRNNEAAVEPVVDREVVRRNVGRRLRLSEY